MKPLIYLAVFSLTIANAFGAQSTTMSASHLNGLEENGSLPDPDKEGISERPTKGVSKGLDAEPDEKPEKGEEEFSGPARIDKDFEMTFDNKGLERYENTHTKLEEEKGLDVHGFAEYRVGLFTQSHFQDTSINEIRVQAYAKHPINDKLIFSFKGEFLHDAVLNESDLELRESYIFMRPHKTIDIKLGRQIILWGTGDLVYVNDFSPKSWTSGFIGREDEYGKLPSDALRINAYANKHHFDFVTNLRFRPDETPQSDRFFVTDPLTDGFIGNDEGPENVYDDNWFEGMTYALRYAYEANGNEYNVYAYKGFWTTPSEYIPPPKNDFTYSRLNAYGASVQGNVAKGIGNIEAAYYDSVDDSDGMDPLINNSLFRTLIGYEQEVATNFSVGMQALYDRIDNQSNYQLYTLRLTKLMLQQTLKLSSFTYYSPTADDLFLKLNLDYQYNDDWTLYAGANVFEGKNTDTFFGGVQDNSNVFLGVRCYY